MTRPKRWIAPAALLLLFTACGTPAHAVTAHDEGSSIDEKSKWTSPCYYLSDVNFRVDGYVQATFAWNPAAYRQNCGSKSKQEVYFVQTVPEGEIRGVIGVNGVQGGERFSIIVKPNIKGLILEMAGQSGRLAQRYFDLARYIAAAKRQSSGWQTAWKRSEQKLREAEQRDKIAPKIVLLSPDVTPKRQVFRVDTYQMFVRGRVGDESGVATVLVNGRRARVKGDGSFASKVKLALGTNRMKVQAEDIRGNVAERVFTVIREEFIPDDTLADVDIPPKTGASNPDGIGVVIGIEGYQYVAPATYAYNDAEVVREYLAETLGFRKDRLKLVTNTRATRAEFDKLLGRDGWLARNTIKSKSDVVVYFSGHGIPDPKTKRTGILSFDVDPNYAFGFPLDGLYANLAKLGARSVTVILDACFTGQTRERAMLIADARPVFVVPKQGSAPPAITVLSAATGAQISGAIKEKEHGLFTYYLLKGMGEKADANGDRRLTVGELATYVRTKVKAQAASQGREQTPQLQGDGGRVLVRW